MNIAAIISFGSAILAGAMAFAILFLGRRSFTHWLFGAGMAILALETLCVGLATDALSPEEVAYWQNWKLVAMALLPGVWLAFSQSYARGNARELLAKRRFALVASLVAPSALALFFHGDLVGAVAQIALGNSWLLILRPPGIILNGCLLIGAILVLMNLERTFRASVGTMRWRIKFMILGLGVLFAVRAYTSAQALLFRSLNLSLQTLDSGALLVCCLLISRSLVRTGHFEVNVYPSQSLLRNSLTLLVAGIYLVIVSALAKLVVLFGGGASFPLKSFLILVSLVLLSVLLLSDRVRLYTSRLVSRHFQRPLHDYRSVWRTFTEGTARCVEQAELCGTIVKLVSGIFQTLSVTIWLVDERRAGPKLSLGASTSLSEAKAKQVTMETSDAAQVIRALQNHPEPVDIDSSKETWAAALRRLQSIVFPKGGHRICVPMIGGGEVLGIMVLCDRVGGVPFSLQDFDLLRSVSDQAAASLLNIQLSQRLSQAKQLEAFQMMSAFFVHDLKNTASTLSLMLQNLPVHYQDPAFREDALRGVSRTVAHINDLISRLSILRDELAIQPLECDLNELVNEALKGQESTPGLELVQALVPLPKVRIDPLQIQKVILNLLLNAREAVGPRGQIRVETSQRNGWVVLAISDNGCGMSAEFIQGRLFRPFQTTKQKGIGIGMFHCKMIVEAHRGRIEVDSEPGKGTAFRVLLPSHS